MIYNNSYLLLWGFFKVYHKELEKVPEFQGFSDFIATFPLRRGKTKSHKNDDEDEGAVGEFKVGKNLDKLKQLCSLFPLLDFP